MAYGQLMNIFEEVKYRLGVQEVLESYGLQFRGNIAKCPFHNDRHPSFSIKDNRWRCWTCNIGGTIIDFVCQIEGINPYEACKLLNEHFNLGITSEKPTQSQINSHQRNKDIIEQYETDLKDVFGKLCCLARIFNCLNYKCELTPLHIIALQDKAKLDYILDQITENKEIFNIEELKKYYKKMEAKVFGNNRKSRKDTVYKSAI